MPMPTIGDSVQYVPAEDHALDRDSNGNYPWVLGWKDLRGNTEELTDSKRIDEVIAHIRRHNDAEAERKKLIFIRPARTWPAVVRAVNDNGTVDLDIQGNTSGVTLHYSGVPYLKNPSTFKPHTCYSR